MREKDVAKLWKQWWDENWQEWADDYHDVWEEGDSERLMMYNFALFVLKHSHSKTQGGSK